MNRHLLASFPSFVIQPARMLAPAALPSAAFLTAQLTPVVKITALLSCTSISGAPVVITAPGRYRLTRNLVVKSGTAITINSDDVTLDLNGYSISSTARPASGCGVSVVGARRNVTIQNGSIQGPGESNRAQLRGGFLVGVSGGNPGATQLVVREVDVVGASVAGIALNQASPSTLVERCRVRACAGTPIIARTVRECVAGEA